ncbi:MAG: thrombospondin type 3 repeat-containing protein [Bacteroidota bacterium]|nr:thrombospondin type 3 repeat-containing protein [Bacteroidota bacterium]
MKKNQNFHGIPFIFAILAIIIFGGGCDKPVSKLAEKDINQGKELKRLKSISITKPIVKFGNGIPRFAEFSIPYTNPDNNEPVSNSIAFINDFSKFYRIEDPSTQLFLQRLDQTNNITHIFFGQKFKNIPVFAAQLAIHSRKDTILITNGSYLPDISSLPDSALVTKQQATDILKKLSDCSDNVSINEPKLYYFNPSLFMNKEELKMYNLKDTTFLTWKMNSTCVPEPKTYFIDAITGAQIFSIDLIYNHNSSKDFLIRTANNTTRNFFTFCGYPGATDWFNASAQLPGVNPDGEGFTAFNSLHNIYDYFFNNFHRHGWNGNDSRFWLTLDDNISSMDNAHFSGQCGDFVFGNNMATLDIIAHEITHAVTNTTSNLVYSNQPGALNESYSDVFAMLIDLNTLIGEGTAIGAIRSMSNPPAFGQPDVIPNFIMTTADNGGVHINSGIPNKVAFLIARGGTHNGITVSGIGDNKTGQLYYFVLTSLLTSNSNFSDAANLTIIGARVFSNLQLHGFTNSDVCAVTNAFASVGLAAADLDCDGISDIVDPDDDGDGVADLSDNCPSTFNSGQHDEDADNIGDACDTDYDGDGILNNNDNCPYTFNSDQKDLNNDGYGDICTDGDNDGVVDATDNCRSTWNSNQADADSDGKGDVCDTDDLDNDGHLNEQDNCPVTQNSNQQDTDNDGVGDVCDNCVTVFNPGVRIYTADGRFIQYYQVDTDADGLGDSCEIDDDNDGILDINDNCPKTYNPNQKDKDNDGIGYACDENEIRDRVLFDNNFQEWGDKLTVVDLPEINMGIPDLSLLGGGDCIPCSVCLCASYLPIGFNYKMNIELSSERAIQIVDDEGTIIYKGEKLKSHSFNFEPQKDSYFSYSKTKGDNIYHGRSYKLVILPSNAIHEKENIKVKTGFAINK